MSVIDSEDQSRVLANRKHPCLPGEGADLVEIEQFLVISAVPIERGKETADIGLLVCGVREIENYLIVSPRQTDGVVHELILGERPRFGLAYLYRLRRHFIAEREKRCLGFPQERQPERLSVCPV